VAQVVCEEAKKDNQVLFSEWTLGEESRRYPPSWLHAASYIISLSVPYQIRLDTLNLFIYLLLLLRGRSAFDTDLFNPCLFE
jgi:hypothetical protein